MKIYVNGKYAIARLTGVQRVGIEIVRALKEHIAANRLDVELVVLTPPAWFGRSRLRPLLALLWEQVVLPLASLGGLLVSLGNTGPVLKRRHAIVLHDAAVFDVPENYSRRYVRVQRVLLRLHAKRARRIFTVSEFSRGRLAHWLGLREQDIELLDLGVDHIQKSDADVTVLPRLGVDDRGYLLAVGSRQPGKNFPALLAAAQIADLGMPIVLVGGVDVTVFGRGALLEDRRLIDAGYVSDGELVALLGHACGYLQPSRYEGFGLPVIEAMALSVPVLCSRAASLPEVCGDAAVFFDPHEPADIASVMSAFLADEDLQVTLRRRGAERVAGLTWRRAAARLLQNLTPLT